MGGLRYGYTAETAPPGMRWAYDLLAPTPGTQYGDLLRVKKDAAGNVGFALPTTVREGLLDMADLLSGVDTGEVTTRGANSVTMGGVGAGLAMAPRGALAAGGARNALPVDLESRMARARELGFGRLPQTYHGTVSDIPAFVKNPPARTTAGEAAKAAAAWTAEAPALANEFAAMAAQARGGAADSGQNILPLRARASKVATFRLEGDEKDREIAATLLDAWRAGYDAVRVANYTSPGGLKDQVIWAFKEPNQLRSPFARFDPARRDSADLLAGTAAPVPVGFSVQPPPGPGFDLPNGLRRPEERVY